MFKSIATITAILISNAAFAQDLDLDTMTTGTGAINTDVTSVVAEQTPAEQRRIAAYEALENGFNSVCALAMEEKLILSTKAMENCASDVMPKPFKSGKQFTKAKTGAEFNTLIANLPIFNANEG